MKHQNHPGFTLLELIVVIAIVGLLATAAWLTLKSSFDQAAIASAIDRVQLADQQARRLSRQAPEGTVALHIDNTRKRLEIPVTRSSWRFSSRVTLDDSKVRYASRTASTGSETLVVPYSASGNSPTFSIRVSAGGIRHWLVVLGNSGQAVACKQESEMEALMR